MLVDQRNKWRESFEQGEFSSVYFDKYKGFRNENEHRMSTGVEYLCEYIIYLEDKISLKDL